jgi:hypothetical protein
MAEWSFDPSFGLFSATGNDSNFVAISGEVE